jgi:putative MATE family efflux protein
MTTANLATTTETALPRGNPYGTILRLALPTVIAMLSQSVVNEVDVYFFSRLPSPESSNAQAALLPSLILVWLFGGTPSAVSVGAQALTARRYAEGRYEDAGAVLANGVFFTVVAGAVLTVLGLTLLPTMVSHAADVPGKAAIMLSYSRWRMLGVISMAMTMALKGFFDGLGRTHVHLVSALVMNVCNVALCWMFIFGHFGAPQMGASGAGFAAFVSTWIGLFIMLVFSWGVRGEYRPLSWRKISRRLTWDILKLSIPAALATIAMMAGFFLFAKAADRIDSQAYRDTGASEAVNSAATTIIVEILKLTFTACMGFGTATATLVGQSLGAREPERAARYGWASVRLGLLLFGVVGLCEGILFTPQIVNFISLSPAVRAATMMPLRIMGVVTPIIAVAMILSEALFGAGNPRFVAIAQGLLVFGILVPGSYALGLGAHMGLLGIWTSAAIYAVLAATAMTLKFRQGKWKSIKL